MPEEELLGRGFAQGGAGTVSRWQEQHGQGNGVKTKASEFREIERTSVWLSLGYFLEGEVKDDTTAVGS